ncbi:MAG: hypothetical protein WC897_00470 [Candidatus Gracilibacteria bacterium]
MNKGKINKSQKALYLFSGILIGLWMAVLFVKSNFSIMISGLSEAGNANWENLRVEILDQIGILIFGLLILSIVYGITVGIVYLKKGTKH